MADRWRHKRVDFDLSWSQIRRATRTILWRLTLLFTLCALCGRLGSILGGILFLRYIFLVGAVSIWLHSFSGMKEGGRPLHAVAYPVVAAYVLTGLAFQLFRFPWWSIAAAGTVAVVESCLAGRVAKLQPGEALGFALYAMVLPMVAAYLLGWLVKIALFHPA